MIRVLYLDAALPVGGAERNNQRVLLGIDSSRFEPHVALLKWRGPVGDELVAAGIPVTENVLPERNNFVGTARALAKLCREVRPDLLFTTDCPLPMFWGGWLRRRGMVPHSCVVFHTTYFENKGLRRKLAWRSAVPVADRVIATGRAHLEYVHKVVGAPREKLVNILNGVDLSRFTPPTDKRPFKEKLGFAPDSVLVGIVAMLRHEKRHHNFVEAAAKLTQKHPKAKFLIIGEGDQRPIIEKQIAELGVGDAVKMIGRRSDIPDLLAALDIATLCSGPYVETLPVNLIEADAMGVPAVSTHVGSVDDIVEDGVSGFLVPHEDHGAYVDRLDVLLSDPSMRARFGAAARGRALLNFGVDNMIVQYERAFSEAVERKTERRGLLWAFGRIHSL